MGDGGWGMGDDGARWACGRPGPTGLLGDKPDPADHMRGRFAAVGSRAPH